MKISNNFVEPFPNIKDCFKSIYQYLPSKIDMYSIRTQTKERWGGDIWQHRYNIYSMKTNQATSTETTTTRRTTITLAYRNTKLNFNELFSQPTFVFYLLRNKTALNMHMLRRIGEYKKGSWCQGTNIRCTLAYPKE